nr:replication factor A protein 1-like isoform X2 [Ipomoea batatas]
MLYVLAKDISPQSYKKAIRLRLIRTYTVTEGRNKSAVKSQECVFHDTEGTYVHASIHADFIDQFSHLLKEGKVYAVKNFVAVSYYYQYKTTQHKFMMRFNQYTTIERHRRKGFPSLLFRIKPIEELLAGKVEEKLLIDVIGRVVEFYSPKDNVIAGFPIQLVDFLIEDSNANNSQSPMVVSTIRDLYERAEEGYYYVPGTIVSIESGKKWFYNSCRKPGCFKSLTLTETYYFCDTCKTNWAEGNTVFELLGITAYDLKTKYSMESESGDEAISPIVQANLKLKGVANDQDEADTGAIKRCLLDQFSSSQNLKKCRPLVIKEEKTL